MLHAPSFMASRARRFSPRPPVPRRKNMTLVAGFRCRDGFVIGADTEITFGSVNYQAAKLADYFGESSGYDIVIGGGGDSVFVDMTSQLIRDEIAALTSPSLKDIRTKIRETLLCVYNDHIFKHWSPGGRDCPYMGLVIGVQDASRNWELLQTDRNAISESPSGFAVSGSGSELAVNVIERVWGAGLSTAITVHVTQQLFREIKGKGYAVGGNTQIIGRRVARGAEEFFDVPEKDYRFLWGMEELLLSSIRISLDRENSELRIKERLNDIRRRLTRIRRATNSPRSRRADTIFLTEFGTEYGDKFKDF